MSLSPRILELVKLIVNSDLPKATRDDITRFFTLPRNTSAKPAIETEETDEEVGVVERPSVEEVALQKDKSQREENKAMNKTLTAVDEQDK